MDVRPVTLDGRMVRLEPMLPAHLEDLTRVGAFEELWKLTTARADSAEGMAEYVGAALADQKRGTSLPFVTIDKASEEIVGSTRFGNIDVANKRAEIGWTWITPAFQRTYVNSEAKLLMLTHAFERWRCVRIELKTDVLNSRSRDAMLRMGATEEGIFRKHILTYSGRWRDSVYYSVVDTEWPVVKARLEGFVRGASVE
jgi:RimJ/RimL family protein N-acetyltransferase